MVMFKMAEGRIRVVLAFVFVYIAGISSALDVSSTVCTSGGTECNSIHNASCDTGLKCKCDQGYRENTTTCTAIGLGDNCGAADDCKTVANSECATTCACLHGYTNISNACVKGLTNPCGTNSDCSAVKNAECDTNCKCSNGYKANGATCVLVYGTVCTGAAICGGLANAACTGGKCACATGYFKSSNICSPKINVSSTTCASGGHECDAIHNASCDTSLSSPKCKCDQGYKENTTTCTAIESGTVSVKSAVGLVFGSMILLLIQAL